MVIKNFLFHRVADEADALWPPMPVSLFETLVSHLARTHEVISLEAWVQGQVSFKTRKPKATILFDDGYKDNLDFAAPILSRYQCPASFYVVTQCIDQNIPTWTYQVDYLFQYTRQTSLSLSLDFVPEAFRSPAMPDAESRIHLGRRLKPWMKTLRNDQRQQVLEGLQRGLPDVKIPRDRMMNWNEVRKLQSAGFSIGSHSVTHPLLASIQDEQDLRCELEQSAARIKAELGFFPFVISYPIGSYDSRVMEISRQLGYTAGLAVEQRFYRPDSDDRFAIPRVELYDEPMWKCRLRISGIYSWLRKTLQR